MLKTLNSPTMYLICGAIILAGVVGLMLAPAKAENAGKSLVDDMNK